MYPEQVKEIQFNTPWAERELNTSLIAETSVRVFFRKLKNPEQWKNYKIRPYFEE